MITVGTDQFELSTSYRVWYERYFPYGDSFTKEEALDFAIKFHTKKQAECKAYGFSSPAGDVFLHCPPADVAELQRRIDEKCQPDSAQSNAQPKRNGSTYSAV